MAVQLKARSFGAGEVAEDYWGHDDYKIHQTGLARCRNFVVRPGGGLTRRPPTEFVAKAYEASILIPMSIGAGDGFVIEMGHLKARFYRNGARLLNGTAVYEIAHPYQAADLAQVRWQRSGDVLYLTHPTRGMWKLTRRGNVDWLSEAFAFKVRPFAAENIDTAKMIRASAANGTVTLTAYGFTFAASDVGVQYKLRDGDQRVQSAWLPDTDYGINSFVTYNGRMYKQVIDQGGGQANSASNPPVHTEGRWLSGSVHAMWEFTRLDFGVVEITAVAPGGATATGVVRIRLPEEFCAPFDAEYDGLARSHRWSREAFNAADGWPSAIAIHQQRLYLIKGPRFWASAPGDYVDFTAKAEPDGALAELVGSTSGQAEDILWMSSGKVALIGASGQEYSLSAQSISEGISPSNLKIVPATSDGSLGGDPVRTRGAVLHLSADGRSLFETVYNFQIDDFDSDDRALPSQHLLDNGLRKIVFQRNPLRIIWACDAQGQLIGFTYNPRQELFAWHAHPMDNATVEDLAVIGPLADGSDELWLRVRRNFCGRDRIFIERLTDYFRRGRDDALTARVFADAQRMAAGENIRQVTGLSDYAGSTLRVVSNRGDEGLFDVDAGGCIQLEGDGVCWVKVGLPYRSHMQLLPAAPQMEDGSSEGRARQVRHLVLRGLGGPGPLAGDIAADHGLAEAVFQGFPPQSGMLAATPREGLPINGDWDAEGMVDLWTDGPFAFEINALDRVMETGG